MIGAHLDGSHGKAWDGVHSAMTNEELKKTHRAVLQNAGDLVRAAKTLTADLDHIRYHLAVLAIEEVGKAELIGVRSVAAAAGRQADSLEDAVDDHVKKLFWSLWGPSFGRQKITKEQLELTQRVANRMHETRLHYLYVDPATPLLPEEKVDHQEVERIVELADARVGLAKRSWHPGYRRAAERGSRMVPEDR